MKGVLYHKQCLLRLAQQGHLRFENSEGQVVDLIPSFNDFLIIEAGAEVLESCLITTKIFEAEKSPTLPYVVERLYTMDQEYEEFINNTVNRREKKKAVAFAKVLREEMSIRFPQFGTDRKINCFANFLNPSTKGVHLKLVSKYESTLEELEECLGEWKGDLGRDAMIVDEDEVEEQPKKLTATEALKKKMKEQEERRTQGRSGRMTIASSVKKQYKIFL